MGAYGQFCPVAKAMELLDERWTMLVIRELMSGSRHFNALRRGRAADLAGTAVHAAADAVARGRDRAAGDGDRVSYALTPAGRELRPWSKPLVSGAIRWIPELGDEDLDPHLLMWDIHRNIDLDAVPDRPDGASVLASVTFPTPRATGGS